VAGRIAFKRDIGASYSVIGSAVIVSDANGIGQPEPGTLEAMLTAMPGPIRFIPTHRMQGFSDLESAALQVRSASAKNPTYFPLTAQSLSDFDWLVALDDVGCSRGGPKLSG
jgi:hypothetical protein